MRWLGAHPVESLPDEVGVAGVPGRLCCLLVARVLEQAEQ